MCCAVLCRSSTRFLCRELLQSVLYCSLERPDPSMNFQNHRSYLLFFFMLPFRPHRRGERLRKREEEREVKRAHKRRKLGKKPLTTDRSGGHEGRVKKHANKRRLEVSFPVSHFFFFFFEMAKNTVDIIGCVGGGIVCDASCRGVLPGGGYSQERSVSVLLLIVF